MDSSGSVAPTPTPVLSPRISIAARRADSRRSKRRPAAAKRRARPTPRQKVAASNSAPASASDAAARAPFSTALSFAADAMIRPVCQVGEAAAGQGRHVPVGNRQARRGAETPQDRGFEMSALSGELPGERVSARRSGRPCWDRTNDQRIMRDAGDTASARRAAHLVSRSLMPSHTGVGLSSCREDR